MEAPETLSDESLADLYRATRAGACFHEIDRRHRKAIFALCRRVLRNSAVAEEITQDVLAIVAGRIDQFRGGAFFPWIHRITYNLCLNYLKSAVRRYEAKVDSFPEPTLSGESMQAAMDRSEQVRKLLNGLPGPQRTCLKLFYIEGYSYEEIAAITGFSGKDVKHFLQEGRRRFRSAWENTQ